MELDTTYILSQVFIIISYVFLISTFQLKNRKWILIFGFASAVMTGLSHLCLLAFSGMAMTVVSMLRNIIFMVRDKKLAEAGADDFQSGAECGGEDKAIEQAGTKSYKYTSVDYAILAVLYAISIGFAILTYQGFLSLMSVFATMLFTYGVWQKNTKVYKFVGIPVSVCWIVYDIYITSWSGMFLESCLMISAIIGLYREYRDMKKVK